jgi:hypothetical protein
MTWEVLVEKQLLLLTGVPISGFRDVIRLFIEEEYN